MLKALAAALAECTLVQRRTRVPSRIDGPALRWTLIILVLPSGVAVPPCMGQQPTSLQASSWESSPLEPQPTSHFRSGYLVLKPKTYKSLGLWIGFGLGVVAVPFLWSSCDKGSGPCSASEKTFIAGAVPIGGALIGSLIGRQFKKGRGPPINAVADSAQRAPGDSVGH